MRTTKTLFAGGLVLGTALSLSACGDTAAPVNTTTTDLNAMDAGTMTDNSMMMGNDPMMSNDTMMGNTMMGNTMGNDMMMSDNTMMMNTTNAM